MRRLEQVGLFQLEDHRSQIKITKTNIKKWFIIKLKDSHFNMVLMRDL